MYQHTFTMAQLYNDGMCKYRAMYKLQRNKNWHTYKAYCQM